MYINRPIIGYQEFHYCNKCRVFTPFYRQSAQNLPNEIDSDAMGDLRTRGRRMTPAEGHASSTPPFEEPIQPEVNANAEEGVQQSSGPEARETPRSSLLVLKYGDSSTLGRKRRSTYQRLMTLLNRWEYQRRSIIRMDLTTANGGD